MKILIFTLFNLLLLTTTVQVISSRLYDMTYEIFQQERINLNLTRVAQLLCLGFMMAKIYLTLDLAEDYAFSVKLMAYTILFCHTFSLYLLR
jgi:hypothetical protein